MLFGTHFRYRKAHLRIIEKKNQCPIVIIVRNKYLDIQVALRDVNTVPTHFVLIPEAGSHDNITKAVFERGDSPASAF